MKKVFTKVCIFLFAGMVAVGFVPSPIVAAIEQEETGNEANAEAAVEHFSVESDELDFGLVSELGRSYTKQIVVQNNTANDITVDAAAAELDDVGGDLVDWITFVGGVTHFMVASGQTKNVNVRIVVPTDATTGTKYARVVLTDMNGYAVSVRMRVDVGGGDLKYSSETVNAHIEPVHLSDRLSGGVTVRNTGTAGFVSQYQVKAKSIFGEMDWRVISEGKNEVMPGKDFVFTVDEALGFGIFSVEQRVTFANSEGRMVESLLSRTVVNIPWWLLAVIGGVILLIVIFVIMIKRHKNGNDSGMERAERKMRRAEIEKIERAEAAALRKVRNKKSDDGEMTEDDAQSRDEPEEDAAVVVSKSGASMAKRSVARAGANTLEGEPIKVVVKKKKKVVRKIQ